MTVSISPEDGCLPFLFARCVCVSFVCPRTFVLDMTQSTHSLPDPI